MKRVFSLVQVFAVLLLCVASLPAQSIHALVPADSTRPMIPCNGSPCDINYNGGPVFENPPTVYIIYYGTWSSKTTGIINYYFSNLSGTSQEKINSTYSDSRNKFITGTLNYNPSKDSYNDQYSLGKSLSGDADIHTIVREAIQGGHLPADTNGIYFVLLDRHTTIPNYCNTFCGYHSPATDIVSGDIIPYAMVGTNSSQCSGGKTCSATVVDGDGNKSPNNDPTADNAVNIMWHEFSESSSDPYVNLNTAWSGNFCGEAADCCAWIFGNLKEGSNGAHYNETIGSKNFITQTLLELKTTSRSGNVPGECENTYVKP